MDETVNDAPREKRFLLARAEARALEWIAARLPQRMMPDHLTGLGVVAAVGIAVAYVLSNENPLWLWVASALLVVHWFGDSLDGTLARVRKTQRPTYGYSGGLRPPTPACGGTPPGYWSTPSPPR